MSIEVYKVVILVPPTTYFGKYIFENIIILF